MKPALFLMTRWLTFLMMKITPIDEQREIIIGNSVLNRLLLVSFTERVEDLIRIISAREVTKRERQDYEENANF